MKYVYFDACSGVSGDMILGALMDLGIAPSAFRKKMAELKQTNTGLSVVPV